MTTIAYDGTTIAADSEQGTQYIVHNIEDKKIEQMSVDRFGGNCYIGASGEVELCIVLMRWFDHGANVYEKPTFPNDARVSALIVNQKGEAFCCSGGCEPHLVGTPAAIGAGAEMALGAMHAGATASQAVEICAKYSPGSSSPVYSLNIADLGKKLEAVRG